MADYYEPIIRGGVEVGQRLVPDTSGFTAEAPRKITQYAFRSRFTGAEKIAIYTAAESSVQVRIWLDDLAAASFVDLDYPATVAGVQALEAGGLIGEGRAAAILA